MTGSSPNYLSFGIINMIRAFPLVLFSTVTICIGCKPQLSIDREVKLEPDQIKTIIVSAVSMEQTIQVTANSSGGPISVHVYLPEHEEAIEEMIAHGNPLENVIAKVDSAEEVTLNALIPADKEAVVRFQPAGRHAADVQVKIRN